MNYRNSPLPLFLLLIIAEWIPRGILFFSLRKTFMYDEMLLAGAGADLAYSCLWGGLFLFLGVVIRSPKILFPLFLLGMIFKTFMAYTNLKYALVNVNLVPLQAVLNYGGDLFGDSLAVGGMLSEAYSWNFIWAIIVPLSACLLGPKFYFGWVENKLRWKLLYLAFAFGLIGMGNGMKWSFDTIRNIAGAMQSHYVYYWAEKPIDQDLLNYQLPEAKDLKKIEPWFIKPKKALMTPKLGYQPNVLFMTMESFRARENSAYGGKKGITPYFDRLSKRGLLFTKIFQNGCCSPSGIWTAQCAQQPQIDWISVKQTYAPVYCASDIFHEKGYDTMWIHAEGGGASRFGAFHSFHHVNHVIDGFQYPKNSEMLGWSYSDGATMDMARKMLPTLKEPFYLHIQTQTNHSPFEIPDGYAIEYGEEQDSYNKYLNAMRYSDEMAGKYLEEFLETEKGKRTIIVITADHGVRLGGGSQTYDRPKENWKERIAFAQVPLLFIFPEEYSGMAGKRVDTLGGMIDILPTLLDVLGLEYPDRTYGYSLLQEREAERFVYMTQDDNHWFLTHDFQLFLVPEVDTPTDWYNKPLPKDSPRVQFWKNRIPIFQQYNLWNISKKNREEKMTELKQVLEQFDATSF